MYPDITRDDVFMLETARLWLRWPRLADAQAIVRLAGDKGISDMTAKIPHPYTLPDAENFIFGARQVNINGSGLVLAVTAKGRPNALIGAIGIQHDTESGVAHLGYWLGRPSWGQGVATEAVETMLNAFFFYTREQTVAASVRVENEASRRVLAKSGMELTGSGMMERPLHGDSVAVDHFELTRAEWSKNLPWLLPATPEARTAVAA